MTLLNPGDVCRAPQGTLWRVRTLHERCRVYAEVADLLRDVLDGEPDGDEQ